MDVDLKCQLDLWIKHFKETLIVTAPVGFTRAVGSAPSRLNGSIDVGILHRKPKSPHCHAIDVDVLIGS